MKLKEACEFGYECGLSTIGEAIDNITFHATSLFPYSMINKEIAELETDFLLTPDIDRSTPIEQVLLMPMDCIDFGKVGIFTDGE